MDNTFSRIVACHFTDMLNESITLHIGEQYKVVLPGLATAGYEWQYSCTNNSLMTIEKLYQPVSSNSPIGVSAKEIFKITASEKGTAQIHFFQVRSWEKKPPAAEKYLNIHIG